MRASVLSTGILGTARPVPLWEETVEHNPVPASPKRWDADKFASEQIRGLVRRVFDVGATPVVKQVVFSAIDSETDVFGICQRVAECLTRETTKEVAIVASDAQLPTRAVTPEIRSADSIRRRATRLLSNLWLVSVEESNTESADCWKDCLEEVRCAFDYSIIAMSPNETVAMGQLADGLILVLSALRTRRASARKFRDALSQVRLLGTVLSDREFPIPEGIYRSL